MHSAETPGFTPPSSGSAAPDARYRPLFELSPQPAWVYDRETLRFLEVNQAASRIYGWTAAEFLALTIRDIRPPGEQARLSRLIEEAPESGRHAAQSVHRTKSGQLRRVEITSYTMVYDGRDARMVLVHDVTDHFESQEALARSEEKYRSAIEQLQDVFFRTDLQGQWTFLNSAWTALTGYRVEDSIGTSSLNYVHPSDRSTLLEAFRPLADGARASTVDVRYFRRDGGYRWVEASAHIVVGEQAQFAGMMGTLRDITERRNADEERQRLSTNIRQLLDSSGEGIYGMDASGAITFVNRRGSEMLGYEPDELIGQSMHSLVHHTHPDGSPYPLADCPIYRTATLGVPCEVADEVMWRKNGSSVQVEYAASPIIDGGVLSGSVVNFRDITSRKRAEFELIVARDAAEAANRAKSDFLARMSHELRTPLNSIIGFANVLLKNKQGALRDVDLSHLTRIATNGQHLLGLINDILDLSKIEAGRMTVELAPLMLGELVRETLGELESHTRDRPVILRAELPATEKPIESDAARLKQVLINLAGNALKFTERGEVVVTLETDPAGAPLALSVRDSGIGIPADRLDSIFDVFEQAESMTARRYGGTGLGLAISRSLCALMGHRLDVTSVEGEGTTMTIRLSQAKSGARLGTPTSMAAIPSSLAVARAGRGPQSIVLVVDDDPDSAELLSDIVEEAGSRPVVAASGIEALRIARELLPSLIFLDLRLPKISGFDVLRILQSDEVLRHTPVVIASVVGTESRGALSGAVAILDKPLERDRVIALIRRWVPSPLR